MGAVMPKMLLNVTRSCWKKRAKGVQNYIVRKRLSHTHYKEVWEKSLIENVINRCIGSDKHQLYTFAVQKHALSSFEDKRAWVTCNKSLPYGHFLLPPISMQPSESDNCVPLADVDVSSSSSNTEDSSSCSGGDQQWVCHKCGTTFTWSDALKWHACKFLQQQQWYFCVCML